MHATAQNLAPQTARTPDPREVLDEAKKRQILNLLRLGCSRRMAARQVQCAHTTIARAAARDPQFAYDLADAESAVDMEALRLVRTASQQEKYWRAAAWLLERRNPEDFARRAHALPADRVAAMLIEVFKQTAPLLQSDKVEDFMQMVNATLREVATAFDPEPATEDLSVQAAVLGLSARAAVADATGATTVADGSGSNAQALPAVADDAAADAAESERSAPILPNLTGMSRAVSVAQVEGCQQLPASDTICTSGAETARRCISRQLRSGGEGCPPGRKENHESRVDG